MRYRSGVLLVLAAGLLWSFQALIIRQIGDGGAWTILFWRSAAMAMVLLGFLHARSAGAPLRAVTGAGTAGLLGGVALAVAMGGAVVAFQTTSVANAAFLFAASPFMAAVLGRLILHERVARMTVFAIVLALVGIFIMVKDGLAGGALVGNLAGLISAFGFAAFTVSLRWRRLSDSLPTVALGSLFAMAAGGLMVLLAGQTLLMDLSGILWCLLMGGGTLAGGMILYALGSEAVPSAELALLSNLEVMLAPVWVWLVMGETANVATLAGGAVLLLAILINAAAGAKRQASARAIVTG